MLKPIAQDDISRLCLQVQMDPAAYVRFALPSIALLAPPERTDAPHIAHDCPVDVTNILESPARNAPTTLRAIAASATQATQTSGPDHGFSVPQTAAVIRKPEPASDSQAAAFVNDVARRSAAPIESDLVALASAHQLSMEQPTVLPLAAAVAGAGVTTVLACLGRALSIIGDRVVLIDASAPSPVDYFFKRHGQQRGLLLSTQTLSTFEGQVHVLRTDTDAPAAAQSLSIRVHRALAEIRGRFNRILVAGRDGYTPALSAQAASTCLVVLTPDLRATLAVPSILKMLSQCAIAEKNRFRPVFLLNRFDESNTSHRECRNSLAAELGSRLLPFSIPESTTVAEALAAGVTPLDLAPQSAFTEACFSLAEWYRLQLDEITVSASQPKETCLVSN